MGFRIFWHAIRMVFTQFGSALRISGLLYVVSFGLTIGLAFLEARLNPTESGSSSTLTWDVVVSGLVALVLYFWTAIGWHRFVLLDELPSSALPSFRGDRMLSYLGRSCQIALVLIVPLIAIIMLMGPLVPVLFRGSLPDDTGMYLLVLLPLVAMVVGLFLAYRLSPLLPAAAIGQRFGITKAWKATRGANWKILGLTVASAIAATIIDIPGSLMVMLPASAIYGIAWLAVSGWLKLMIGVSIITTIYGVYVEGRAIG